MGMFDLSIEVQVDFKHCFLGGEGALGIKNTAGGFLILLRSSVMKYTFQKICFRRNFFEKLCDNSFLKLGPQDNETVDDLCKALRKLWDVVRYMAL